MAHHESTTGRTKPARRWIGPALLLLILAVAASLRLYQIAQVPPGFHYDALPSLSSEARQKLAQIQPHTLGQASRITGVSPADIATLYVALERGFAGNK